MITFVSICFGLAAFVIVLALVGVLAVHSHEDEYQEDEHAGEDSWGNW